ncbi:hypothetical protein [Comamonas sp. JC664]|uniref:hypothetical protein n=1 Tax=Comamonas sp. JC664 TaxID=2801917 RepID=UPI00174D2B3C|nr:hypothetical protein [Comamonas sp. JC664]MBL0697865.1 hypothetical protein [Comamonas sp. JC664]GHG70036.1 hypothetical protein GCM10012319_14610 [Comamonas sp. KCTC 72670]
MAIVVLEEFLHFGPSYSLTGGWECMFERYALPDVLICIALPLVVIRHGKRGPNALWTGIVTSEFLRYMPSAALLAWLANFSQLEIGRLHHTAYFWWTLRALVASAAIIWLCMKRDRPGWRMMFVSGLASLTLLGLLSHRATYDISGPLPWLGQVVVSGAKLLSP